MQGKQKQNLQKQDKHDVNLYFNDKDNELLKRKQSSEFKQSSEQFGSFESVDGLSKNIKNINDELLNILSNLNNFTNKSNSISEYDKQILRNYSEDVARVRRMVKTYEEKALDFEIDIRKLEKEGVRIETQKTQLTERINALKGELKDSQKLNQKYKDAIKYIEIRNDNVAIRHQQIENKIKELRNQDWQLGNEDAEDRISLNREVEKLKEQNLKSKQLIELHLKDKQELKVEVARLKGINEDAEQRLQLQQGRNDELREQNQSLRNQQQGIDKSNYISAIYGLMLAITFAYITMYITKESQLPWLAPLITGVVTLIIIGAVYVAKHGFHL